MEKLRDMISLEKTDEFVKSKEKCEKEADYALKRCPLVVFMVKAMDKMGCKVDSSLYSCMKCDGKVNGGFQLEENKKPSVILCQNHIQNQDWMNRTLAHELIHAYDHCRAKVDWTNCHHHACSEVRAAALSGDCNWSYEFARGNFNIAKQHQICTKRRAILSLKFNDYCKGKEEEFVNEVFQTCYKDTTPFTDIP